jgi:4-coumarate--CoA ligase
VTVAAQVVGYKQIRRLEVIETIPRSPAGKILRRVLRDAALAQVASPG